MQAAFKASGPSKDSVGVLTKLSAYYEHQADLLKGFEKNSAKLEEGLKPIQVWVDEIQELVAALGK